jgi:hypothetical protein
MQRNTPSRRRGGTSRNGSSRARWKSVGPNARLVEDDLEAAIRELKAERDGEIEVAGPGRRSALWLVIGLARM